MHSKLCIFPFVAKVASGAIIRRYDETQLFIVISSGCAGSHASKRVLSLRLVGPLCSLLVYCTDSIDVVVSRRTLRMAYDSLVARSMTRFVV